jgi:hypothetical protein
MNLSARLRRTTRPQALAASVAVIVVVIAGVLLQRNPGATSVASPSVAGSPGAESPTGSAGADWAGLTLSPLTVAASLEPTRPDPAGVASDTAFRLTSLTGESSVSLASRLDVSPPLDLAIASGAAGAAVLSPKGGLQPNELYRFTLRAPDGSIAGSWAFRVRGPVGVLSTIPGDAEQGVPVRTGIEVAFNQEGVADMASHFAISPTVAGRYERHGLTQVFVPASLDPATLYTVTIRAGLGRTGTDLTLPSDVVFRFETEGPELTEPARHFAREVVESSPAERPVMAVVATSFDGTAAAPGDADITVYRIAALDAAARTLADFLAQPHWAAYTSPRMPTEGLPVAATFSAPLESFGDRGVFILRFPDALDQGWYVVEMAGTRTAQAFLQVTPVSAWVSVLSDRTVVWVNDVVTGRALENAAVSVDDGPAFARADGQGLALGDTPAALIPPGALGEPGNTTPAPILRVTLAGRGTVLVPFGVSIGDGYRGEWWEKWQPANETYWSLLFTDRQLYRSDDRVEVWGYLRDRDDMSVPGSIALRMVRSGFAGSGDAPSIVAAIANPGKAGAFTAQLPIAGLPTGWYVVEALVGGEVVASRWVEVSIIRKPSYQLELLSDHAAVLAGDPVQWTVSAIFFDGTPAASVPLTVDSMSGAQGVTTGPDGRAGVRLTARREAADWRWEDVDTWWVEARPTGPEGGDIWANHRVLVFPSAYHLVASGIVAASRLEVSGSLHRVDLARVERQLADGTWEGDPAGAAVGGASIQASITELIPVKRLVRTEYDFVEKISRPVYEYDIERKPVRSLIVPSGADGEIAFMAEVPDAAHEYEIVLATTDDAGRPGQRTIYAGQAAGQPWWAGLGPVFEQADGELAGETPYRIGSRVAWQIADGGRAFPSGGRDRYLYITAQRGLRSVAVSDSSTFRHAFRAADAPGIYVMGVRFTGSTYAPKAAAWADFDSSQRAITVEVTADRERYRPGELVTLAVNTTDEAGQAVAARVVLQGVDEKLYAMGGASTARPLEELYTRVDSGVVRLTSTHQVPTPYGLEGEGGDATGGGARSDFRDTLFFVELATDATGRATTTVRLSDDLTSWHIAASAVTASLEAGVGELLVPVGLPFFVEATIADTYLISDRPAIQLRAFGEGLAADDPVEFTIASANLGLASTKVAGKAFVPVWFELPELSLGSLFIDIAAVALTRTDAGGKPLADRLRRTFQVVDSRLTEVRAAYGTIADPPTLPEVSGITAYTFTDAGRGRYLPLLVELTQSRGARLDSVVAQSIARRLLIDEFGVDPSSFPPVEIDLHRYEYGSAEGLALLPYSSPDPWLTVRVALADPDAIGPELRDQLLWIRDAPSTLRDLEIAAIAALASIGEPVLANLNEIRAMPDLSPMERIYLALGFAALGDDASALEIERALLGTYGERLGSWVRLRVGAGLDEMLEATALLGLVAAGVGDPLATGMLDYVMANPGKETTHALDLAAMARRILARTPASEASFSYTVGGERRVIELEPGDSFAFELTAAQRASLSLERLEGEVGVTVEGRVRVDVAGLRPSPDLTLARTGPTGPIPTGRVVVVDLAATFRAGAPEHRCYDVVEQVPSGMAPLEVYGSYETNEGGLTWPSRVVGQEVIFCVANDARTGHAARLRYLARIVSPGVFTWEPAIMQLAGAPEALAFTPPAMAVIGEP